MKLPISYGLYHIGYVKGYNHRPFSFIQIDKHRSQNRTISDEECMMWSDIFEEWPKAEKVNGNRTFEFLPSEENNGTMTYPGSLYNITYITWEDNRSCGNSIRQFFILFFLSDIDLCHMVQVVMHS